MALNRLIDEKCVNYCGDDDCFCCVKKGYIFDCRDCDQDRNEIYGGEKNERNFGLGEGARKDS